ncbi:MAG: SIMPL domain-containing protein [Acidimicrobiales bacterium]
MSDPKKLSDAKKLSVSRTSQRPIAILMVAALGLAAAGCGSSAAAQDKESTSSSSTSSKRTLTTTATGKAKGVPDNVVVDVTVVTSGPSAAAVLADNNSRTQKVLDQLKFTGLEDKDVSTTSVDLGPRTDKKGNIVGYVATNALQLTFRDLKSAGAKLDTLVSSGDNRIRVSSFRLGFNDDDELLGTARADAVKRARSQADEMAKAAGTKVARVRTITEVNPQQFGGVTDRALPAGGASASSVPIAAGSRELNVQVKVVFDLG